MKIYIYRIEAESITKINKILLKISIKNLKLIGLVSVAILGDISPIGLLL